MIRQTVLFALVAIVYSACNNTNLCALLGDFNNETVASSIGNMLSTLSILVDALGDASLNINTISNSMTTTTAKLDTLSDRSETITDRVKTLESLINLTRAENAKVIEQMAENQRFNINFDTAAIIIYSIILAIVGILFAVGLRREFNQRQRSEPLV